MIHVRPATVEDAPFIVEAQLRMAWETEQLRLDEPTVKCGVRAVFDEEHRGRYYVAEADGQLAGCLLTVPEWSDWRNGTVLWIHSVYVADKHRRSGVFRSLYNYLREKVQEDPNFKGLRLYVHKDNQVARNVYRAMEMDGEHYQLFEWMK